MSSTTPMNMSSILAALAAIESQVASVRSAISSEAKPSLASKSKKASAKQAPADADADADAPVKTKRLINPKIAAMNDERKVIFAEMKGAWALANPSFASLAPAELKKAISEGQVAKPPSFPDAIKEHSRRLRENDPEAEARHQTYLAKRAKKEVAPVALAVSTKAADTETVASGNSSDSKSKRGPKPGFKLSDEEKAKRAEKRKQNAALKKSSGMPALPHSPDSLE